MTRRKRAIWKTALILAVFTIVGALYKNTILGWTKKVPGLGNIDSKIGEQAVK